MTPKELRALDREYVWHPFTPIDTWTDSSFDPVAIVAGDGAYLIDDHGRRYLDGNASIWTNLHGHRQPHIAQALKEQIDRISHSSFLGLTNDRVPVLAERLHKLTGVEDLKKCFFSDDGSTSIEAAVKIVYRYFQQNGQPQRSKFVSLDGGYHGDTVGAMSVGHSDTFHGDYRQLFFKSEKVMTPYCYRCPYNQAKPERCDARLARKCNWECVGHVEKALEGNDAAGFVIEPKVQAAEGMIMHPEGYLKKIESTVQQAGAKFILDEVMTGFGRTGEMFAFQKESVQPDVLCLSKGLTAGHLPMAVTMVKESIFDGFRGSFDRTFYHGHSYSGNQLGAAAALANLDLLEKPDFMPRLKKMSETFHQLVQRFWRHPNVGDVRVEGMTLGVELVRNWKTREPIPYTERIGYRISEHARKHGLLVRAIGSVLILVPPYCASEQQLEEMVRALDLSIGEILK